MNERTSSLKEQMKKILCDANWARDAVVRWLARACQARAKGQPRQARARAPTMSEQTTFANKEGASSHCRARVFARAGPPARVLQDRARKLANGGSVSALRAAKDGRRRGRRADASLCGRRQLVRPLFATRTQLTSGARALDLCRFRLLNCMQIECQHEKSLVNSSSYSYRFLRLFEIIMDASRRVLCVGGAQSRDLQLAA